MNKTKKPSPFRLHVDKWTACTACPLCKRRKKVVIARGKVPCDVLFIGEAPGQSEDVLGVPFVGPAGQLLDQIVEKASRGFPEYRLCYTNLIACIPRDESWKKITEPPKESVTACLPRLEEFVAICKPKVIVMVGSVASNFIPKFFGYDHADAFVSVDHPAYIIRSNPIQRPIQLKRVEVTLREEVFEFLYANSSTEEE